MNLLLPYAIRNQEVIKGCCTKAVMLRMKRGGVFWVFTSSIVWSLLLITSNSLVTCSSANRHLQKLSKRSTESTAFSNFGFAITRALRQTRGKWTRQTNWKRICFSIFWQLRVGISSCASCRSPVRSSSTASQINWILLLHVVIQQQGKGSNQVRSWKSNLEYRKHSP